MFQDFFFRLIKSLCLNSITFGNPEYTDWNIIGNQILKASNIARYFMTSRTFFQLQNIGSPRKVLTATTLPRPIRSRFCLPFFQCSECSMLQLQWFYHTFIRFLNSIIVHRTSNFNRFKCITFVKNFICFYQMRVLNDNPLMHWYIYSVHFSANFSESN